MVVRLAELEIYPAQLESYKVFLREEIETSIRIEPGVLALYAVAVKGHPTQSTVKSLNLLETAPVLSGRN